MPPKLPPEVAEMTAPKRGLSKKKQKIIRHGQQLPVRVPTGTKDPQKLIGAAAMSVLESTRPLPGAIDVESFVSARSHEIHTIHTAMRLAAARLTSRAFQSLPRHLRRRAASHNFRRVPLRLREKAKAEIDEKDDTVRKQRKRAKQRRKGKKERPTSVYLKRQLKKTWLETHIWHAKRMHMIDIWGHRIARTPTLKSRRPAYRAARNSSIINDVSYFSTVQISGKRDRIVRLLKWCLGMSAWAGGKYETGARIAHTTIHHHGLWPRGLIGPTDILWRPQSGLPERQVWLRFHPAMFEEVWRALDKAMKVIKSEDDDPTESGVQPTLRIEDLRGEINCFEIMGPKAGLVLQGVTSLCKSENGSKRKFWLALNGLQTSANVSKDMVVGLQLHDPRLSFPPHNSQREPNPAVKGADIIPSLELCKSELWDAEIRAHLIKPTFKKADLDARRQQLGLPGSRLRLDIKDDRVPIMVIQTSRQNKNSDENPVHGFLILLPSGWAMPFWQSLVFTGSLIGGVDERRIQHQEAGLSSFPEAFPATESYRDWWTRVETHDVRRWQRRPPAKRLNLSGLGPQRGWQPDWKLVAQHAQDEGGISQEELAIHGEAEVEPWLLPPNLAEPILGCQGTAQAERELERICCGHRQRLDLQSGSTFSRLSLSECLVQVVIEYTGRGKPSGNAAIFSEKSGTPWKTPDEVGDWDNVSALSQQHILKPDPKLVGFVFGGGLSLARGHGYATGAVSLLSLLRNRFDQTNSDPRETRVLVRNRGDQIAWPAVVRLGS